MILNNPKVRFQYPFIFITPGSTLAGVVTSDRVLFMGQIELNCVLMLNLIVLTGTAYVC